MCWLWRERCGTWTTWPHDPLVDLGQMHVNKHLVGILSLPWGGGRRGEVQGRGLRKPSVTQAAFRAC